MKEGQKIKDKTFERIYKHVSSDQREQVVEFRRTHRCKTFTVDDHPWEYTVSGSGERTVLLLPGGTRRPFLLFNLVRELEKMYRVLSLTFPRLSEMEPLVEGIASVIENEGIHRADILGISFGGFVAQCFVHKYPEKVSSLILGNTGTTTKENDFIRILKIKFFILSILPSWLVRFLTNKISNNAITTPEAEKELYKALLKEAFHLRLVDKEDVLCHFKGLIDFFENYSFTAQDLINWKGRILIIGSDNDRRVEHESKEALKSVYLQAKIHTFCDAGHTANISRTNEYVSLLQDFLKTGEVPP